MLRRVIVIVGVACLLFSGRVQADFIVLKSGSVTLTTGPTTTTSNTNQINGDANNGIQFVNSTGTNAFPNGTNNHFTNVGANLLSTYSATNGATTAITFNGSPVVAVFAASGFTNSTASTAVTQTGVIGLFTIPSVNSFNAFNPATWGAVSNGALNTPIASFTLKIPQDVFDPGVGKTVVINGTTFTGGGKGNFNFAPDQTNQASLNLVTGATGQAGVFLAKQTGGSVNPFFTITGDVPITPPGFNADANSIVTQVIENLQSANSNSNTAFINGGVGTTGFDDLNIIAKQLGLLPDLGSSSGVGTAFATSFGDFATATSFDPSTANNGDPPNTADFVLGFGTTTEIGLEFASPPGNNIPEIDPNSIAGALTLLGGGLAYMTERLRRKKK